MNRNVFFASRWRRLIGSPKIFATHLSDEAAFNLLARQFSAQQKSLPYDQARSAIRFWRKYFLDLDYRGPMVWQVEKDFTLRRQALRLQQCQKGAERIRGWNFADIPTEKSLVFWAPRLAKGSMGKSVVQMVDHRNELKRLYKLSSPYCASFGSIQLLFALSLAHLERTGERVPANFLYAASDTMRADGKRLTARYDTVFESCDLLCEAWNDSVGDASVGFFLIGVEDISQLAKMASQ